MLTVAGLCVSWVLCAEPGPVGMPPDGIYTWTAEGKGRPVRRNDGAEVFLGARVGPAAGQAAIRSVKNDNSLFVLRLKNAGPVAKGGSLALVIDGICLGVWSQSDRHADGTIDLSCSVHGGRAARKVAAHFKAEMRRRKDPGHRINVHWSTEKESYRVGEPVVLKMEIRNVGPGPITFRVGGQQRGPRDNQYRFLAYHGGGGGKAVPDTGDPTNFGGIGSYRTLKPGEAFVSSVPLDGWFTFTEPDTYRVTGLFELELHDHSDKQGFGEAIWDDLAVGDCLVRVVPKGG